MSEIQIGRLMRSNTTEFVVGCSVSQIDSPSFGALVRCQLIDDLLIYGLIRDLHVADDGLIRQLVTTESVDESVIADNRVNRNVPVEISVLTVGFRDKDEIQHLLPPHPPLSLDAIFLCNPDELREFTSPERFGYFRHILRDKEIAIGELLAAHLKQAGEAHSNAGNPDWINRASKELITILRDDYPTLMAVLGALSDAFPGLPTS